MLFVQWHRDSLWGERGHIDQINPNRHGLWSRWRVIICDRYWSCFGWLWNHSVWALAVQYKQILVRHIWALSTQFEWCMCVHKTMLILRPSRQVISLPIVPKATMSHSAALTVDNNWLTILKTSTTPCVFPVLQTAGTGHEPDKLVSGSAEPQPCSLADTDVCLKRVLHTICQEHNVWLTCLGA